MATAGGPAGAREAGRRPPERVLTVIAVLLTFASGGLDVGAFARLGNVFASVMTGNMVVFGLSLARGSLSLGLHTGAAVCGYAAGVAVGTRFGSPRARDDWRVAGPRWPPTATPLLLAELALLVGYVVGWEVTGSRPAGGAQVILLVVAACSMGLQSAVVVQMNLAGVSTTYLTGTLTGLVSSLVRGDGSARGAAGLRRPGVLLGLLAGAALAGLLIAYAGRVAPLPPLLAVAVGAALTSGRLRRAFPNRPEGPDRDGDGHTVTARYLRD